MIARIGYEERGSAVVRVSQILTLGPNGGWLCDSDATTRGCRISVLSFYRSCFDAASADLAGTGMILESRGLLA